MCAMRTPRARGQCHMRRVGAVALIRCTYFGSVKPASEEDHFHGPHADGAQLKVLPDLGLLHPRLRSEKSRDMSVSQSKQKRCSHYARTLPRDWCST